MRVLGLVAQKGGCAKTTTSLALAAGLARSGRRVLVVDTDPQGNASLVLLRGEPAQAPTLGDVLLERAEALDAIRPAWSSWPGVDVLPAAPSLAEANLTLAGEIGRESRLRVALATVSDRYDVAILDTSPGLSILTVNALAATHDAYVPVDAGVFALAGLARLQDTVADVRRYLGNPALRIAGLVLVRVAANNVNRELAAHLVETFGPLVCRSTIPQSVKVEESHARFVSVLDYAPRSPAARAYTALVSEVIGHETRIGTRQSAGGPVAVDPAA
jgi:chromosome partitioning protein